MLAYGIPRRSGWTKPIIYSAFLILGLLPLSAFAVTASVGATPGSFSVNNNGGANYTIPITAPPGTAGIVPRLALSYDKQVQNDLLGVGWSVSGLSLIQRCGGTIALDGMKGGVNYNANDRFCLDGQRLVAINNGTYGADGTEYRTQQESFIKILSYGAIPYPDGTTGPSYFKVYLKNGTVMEYGNTTDSKIEAADKTVVRLWALNKSQDTKGNYLTITYDENNINGEYRPTRIDYTGNATVSPAYNSVRFVYATRPDIVPRFEGGSIIKTTQLLMNVHTCTTTATDITNVQTCQSTALVRDYRLAYDNNGAVGSSRLISVTECGSDGVCLPATAFGWQNDPGTGFTAPPDFFLGDGSAVDNPFVLGDFNGDGKMDLLYPYQSAGAMHVRVKFSNGDGTFTAPPDFFLGDGSDVDNPFVLGDFNGDGKTDLLYPYQQAGFMHVRVKQASGHVPDLLISISTGLGVQTSITYKPLTDNLVYTKDSGAAYPYEDVQNATYVVSSYTTSDGLGGTRSYNYTYKGAKTHLAGGGWLGFREIQVRNQTEGLRTTTNYQNQVYDGTHALATNSETARISDNRILKSMQYFWSASACSYGPCTVAQLDGTIDRAWELDGLPTTHVTTDYTYDAFGNALTVNAASNDGHSKLTTNTYTNNTTQWILGLATRIQVDSTVPGPITQTRVSSFNYDTATGLLLSSTIEPNSVPDVSLTTSHTYDVFGNKLTTTVSGPDIAARTDTLTYDSRGQFVTRSTNAINQSDTFVTDPRWGAVISQTGPNGLTISFSYDGFGRKLLETRADATTTSTEYHSCTNLLPGRPEIVCPVNASHLITAASSGSPPSTVYYDSLGRVLRTQTDGFDGTLVYQDTVYDSQGRVIQASRPYYANEAIAWTTTAYDILGRISQVTAPDNSTTTSHYAGRGSNLLGFIVRVTALGNTTTKIINSQGQTIQVTDALASSSTFTYGTFGNLTQVRDPAGNTVTMSYDRRGRKTGMTDPDMGTWTYTYDVLSQLVSQTANQQPPITMTYDLLGRLISRTEPEGISTWTYDTAIKGIGKLAQVTSPGYSQTYNYDSLSRPRNVTTMINGTNYLIDTAYDSLSRIDTVIYPSYDGINRFAIRNIYNAQGYLAEVRNASTAALYWRGDARNALGQFTQEALGNSLVTRHQYNPLTGLLKTIQTGTFNSIQNLSYEFDTVGNLTRRSDHNQNVTEFFTYDKLHRLTATEEGPVPKTYAYDRIGNLLSKTDVGIYTYGQKPHAVASTSGPVNASYTYDANGNMVSGNGRTLSYTSFNKPLSISANGATTHFTYDANHNRIIKTTATSQTVYLGLYEKITNPTDVAHKHYVSSPTGRIAIVTYRNSAPGIPETRYIHKDHLGSLETITDETGAIKEQLSFDPHGKRRNPNWQDATGITSSTSKGYTGHEMDDEFSLINMNAREYDPLLGRFLQPDSVIQSPESTQSYNRYTYVNNNPLSYTDPTGHRSLRRMIRNVGRAWAKMHVASAMVAIGFITGNIPGAIAGAKAAWDTNEAYNDGVRSGDDLLRIGLASGLDAYGKISAVTGPITAVTAGAAAGSATGNSLARYAANQYVQAQVRQEVAEIAQRHGMSLTEFNLGLLALSGIGNALPGVDSRYKLNEKSPGWGMRGFLNRGVGGLPFDIVDAALEYQGIPSASQIHYLLSPQRGQPLTGHSLGALTVSNLESRGITSGSTLIALPFGNIAEASAHVVLHGGDPVSGFWFGFVTNPGATLDPGSGHSCAGFIGCPW